MSHKKKSILHVYLLVVPKTTTKFKIAAILTTTIILLELEAINIITIVKTLNKTTMLEYNFRYA